MSQTISVEREHLLQEMEKLWALKYSVRQIGAKLGQSPDAITGLIARNRTRFARRLSPRTPGYVRGWKPTEEQIARVKLLRARRTPYAQIAQDLGVSRHDIEQLMSRKVMREDSASAKRKSVAPVGATVLSIGTVQPFVPSAITRPIPKAKTCCWPLHDAGEPARFCCRTIEPELFEAGKPYCFEHAQIAYVRVREAA